MVIYFSFVGKSYIYILFELDSRIVFSTNLLPIVNCFASKNTNPFSKSKDNEINVGKKKD